MACVAGNLANTANVTIAAANMACSLRPDLPESWHPGKVATEVHAGRVDCYVPALTRTSLRSVPRNEVLPPREVMVFFTM